MVAPPHGVNQGTSGRVAKLARPSAMRKNILRLAGSQKTDPDSFISYDASEI